MTKKILLLTMWYPYGPGESYIETEIHHLCQAFDSVYVLPTSYLGDRRSSIRRMPNNAELLVDPVAFIQVQYEKTRFRRVLDWSKNPTYRSYLRNDLHRAMPHGRQALQSLLGFLSTSLIILKAMQISPESLSAHLIYSSWLSAGTLAALTLRNEGYAFKVVSRVHRRDLYVERHTPPYLPLHGYMATNVDKLVAISEHGLLYLQERYPAVAERLVLNRVGVPEASARARTSRDERLRIVTCSSLTPVKRLDLWIRALTLCRAPVSWSHIGSGLEEGKIRDMAANLPPHIQWRLLGEVPNEDVLRYYATEPIDLFVNVSSSEGLPLAIMEAFSFGIPVAATSAGGTRELISVDNGILWSVDVSPEEIAAAIDNFAVLPQSAKAQMREAAVKTWRSEANADRQYAQFIKLLYHVCEPGE